jgi:Tfp pilus assembly protein PilN
MVTNINLVAPESERKISLTGKTSLVLSVSLVVLIVLAYFGLSIASKQYAAKKNEITLQVQQEKARIQGSEYAEIADFQQRLDLLDKIITEHPYADSFLRNFSKYILPEVKLSSFDWKSDGAKVSIKGTAPNFDVLSRQMILLKSAPFVQSVEFKNATESSGSEGAQAGVSFGAEFIASKNAFDKI